MTYINEDERGLLVVANLSTGGQPQLQPLVEWLDKNAINVAKRGIASLINIDSEYIYLYRTICP